MKSKLEDTINYLQFDAAKQNEEPYDKLQGSKRKPI